MMQPIINLHEKRQAAILDYDLDQSSIPLATTTATNSTNPVGNLTTNPITTCTTNYAAELLSLKKELSNLRNFITSAVAELKSAIVSLPMQCNHSTSDMEIENGHNLENPNPSQPAVDIQAIVQDLKHELATITQDIATITSHPIFNCNRKAAPS